MRHRVLITGVGGNIGQGVLKALRAGKRSYYAVGLDMEPLSAGFSLVESYYRVPKTGDAEFEEVFASIVQKEAIEGVYVCSPREIGFFSSHKEDLERKLGVNIFVNPEKVVKIGSDKLGTANFLKEAGFSYLETAIAIDNENLDRLIKDYGFPLLVKPRRGFTSENVFIVNSRDQINAATALIPDLIVQRYLPDSSAEYTAGTVSDPNGNVRASIVLHRHLIQGTTYRTELVENANFIILVERIAEALGAVGACNFQFRLLDGEVFVFEINPRFSGTSGIRYLYGFNDPEMVFELFSLGIDVSRPTLSRAVVLRYWNEIFIPGTNFQVLREGDKPHCGSSILFNKPYFDNGHKDKLSDNQKNGQV